MISGHVWEKGCGEGTSSFFNHENKCRPDLYHHSRKNKIKSRDTVSEERVVIINFLESITHAGKVVFKTFPTKILNAISPAYNILPYVLFMQFGKIDQKNLRMLNISSVFSRWNLKEVK